MTNDKMNFYIQAGNPRLCGKIDMEDKKLSDAIETVFLLNTENAIMVWNHINIPLSYKYDISYMMDDLLKLLRCLYENEAGTMTIHWLPDTFRCNWFIMWQHGQMKIESHWECTVGNLEGLLNNHSEISLPVNAFANEWKEVLRIITAGLKRCGYDEDKIKDMKQLFKQYELIADVGYLYKEYSRGDKSHEKLEHIMEFIYHFHIAKDDVIKTSEEEKSLFMDIFNLAGACEVVNWTSGESYCYEFKILLCENQKILDDDIILIKELNGVRMDLRIFISAVAPYYYMFTEETKYDESDNKWQFITVEKTDEKTEELVKKIDCCMKKRNYEKLTPTIVKTTVPGIETELKESGQATVFDCLFTDMVDIM